MLPYVPQRPPPVGGERDNGNQDREQVSSANYDWIDDGDCHTAVAMIPDAAPPRPQPNPRTDVQVTATTGHMDTDGGSPKARINTHQEAPTDRSGGTLGRHGVQWVI